MAGWNPWHGCHKISAGCANCYVYRMDSHYGRDSAQVEKNGEFSLPIQKNRHGEYKIGPGEMVYTCFTSDFFLEDADPWRPEAWAMIRERQDLHFLIITKRIHRLMETVPEDWGRGYENVTVCCTVENQDRADYRLPIFLEAPIRHKQIICSPLLGEIQISQYLGGWIEGLVAGGESGEKARICRCQWVLSLREQCREAGVPFYFQQTGARFEKNGRLYRIPRRLQHQQARLAGLNLNEGIFVEKYGFLSQKEENIGSSQADVSKNNW